MSNLARYNPSVSIIEAEIVAENYLQRVPAEYRTQLQQPIVYLAQQGEDGSIQQLINAAIERQDLKLYRWVRQLQPELEAMKRRQNALEDRVEKLERRPAYDATATDEPPSNFHLLSILVTLLILAAMLVGGSIERDISPRQPAREVRQ